MISTTYRFSIPPVVEVGLVPPALPNKAVGSQVSDRTLVSTKTQTRL